jgi:hypothetical protein
MLPRFQARFLSPEGEALAGKTSVQRSSTSMSARPQGRFQGLAARETSNVVSNPEKDPGTDEMLVIGHGESLGANRIICAPSALKSWTKPGAICRKKAISGLKPSTRRLLERWGRSGSERAALAEPARTRLKARTVLVREWHGVIHRVTMMDDGFDFDGERFRSLRR